MIYPEDEYEYIYHLAYDRWWGEVREIDALKERARSLVVKSEYRTVVKLEEEIEKSYKQSALRLARAEEIVYWLKTDSELRREGTTFPNWSEKNELEARCLDN